VDGGFARMLTVFGPGYIGGRYCEMFPGDTIPVKRYQRNPESQEILYFISTIDNGNIHTDIKLDVETNLGVLCQTLDYCRDSSIVFNFISSWFVYGDCELPAKEDTPCNPRGFYSITKKCAEDLLIDFCRTYKVKYRILRMPNVVGGYDPKASIKKNAIHYLINELKEGNDITLYNDGNIIKDIMHVDDVCRAINRVVNRGEFDTIYNIGSGQQITLGDIIRRAKKYIGSESQIFSKEAYTQDMFLDSTKLFELGFKPQKSHFDIIRELCTN
jgi:nucleoside-diphosphate-sugar epimerase